MIPVIVPGDNPALTIVVAAITVVALILFVRAYWRNGRL